MEKNLADTLRRLRNERNMTQAEAAKECDISLRYYQSLESAEQADPSLSVIRKIISGFKIEPSEILGHPRKEPPPKSYSALLEALTQKNKEFENFKRSVPEDLIALWNQLDKYDRNTIIESLKVLVKDKEKSTSGESSGGTSA